MTTQLTRRDPLSNLNPIDRLINQFFTKDPFFFDFGNGIIDEGTLPLDVSETEKEVVIRASLPGFRKEDIHAEVHDGVLTINATRSEEEEETGEKFYRKERRTGSFSRRLALPASVSESNARAELKDGILQLRLQKAAEESPSRIPIQ